MSRAIWRPGAILGSRRPNQEFMADPKLRLDYDLAGNDHAQQPARPDDGQVARYPVEPASRGAHRDAGR